MSCLGSASGMLRAFADKESYEQNADDPGQDEWYQRLRAVLQSDPDWEDGDIISG